MAAPVDPDAALHAAQPGKFKPASADAPPAPSEPGTLSDSVERLPNYAPVKATQAPMEPAQSWGDWLGSGWGSAGSTASASKTLTASDTEMGYNTALGKGYGPIVDGLGLGPSENPAAFEDPYAGTVGQIVHGAIYGFSRADQEKRLADLIKAGRAKNPGFMPGVPDDPVKLRQYAMAADTKARADARAQLAAAPQGLGTFAGTLGGSAVGSFEAPENIIALPIGGSGKTILGVIAREALINGTLTAAQLPNEAKTRAARGEAPLTAREAVTEVAGGALGGAVLGSAFHGAGKAIGATGLPEAVSRVVGNLDLANTLSYKLYSAMPEAVQRKWGAGIVTKWAHRLANGEKLEDVFSNLSNVELATLSKTVIGADRMTPEERAAAEHLTRTEEVGDSSPYEPGPTGDGTHEEKLQAELNSIINNRPVEEAPSAPRPSDPGAAVASPADPARPPAALSTARRPLSPALEAARLPADIYDGLTKRGIPDHIARGIAAGTFAEARGSAVALNPKSGAFGLGQWLGARKDELFRRYGPSPSLDQQLDFIVHELKGGDPGGKSVLSAKDEVDALHRYIGDFMRPAKGFETDRDLAAGMKALGRGGEPLPEGELAGAGGSADVGPDPDIARLREEALNLDDAVIGAPSTAVPPMYARQFRTDELTVDAARFQFKSGADDLGVTERLRGIKEWNPMYAGRVVAWEDAGGRVFLADGHQRFGLARRLESEGHPPIGLDTLVLREADGVSADDARVYGALKNIAEGTGSMVDAAKVIRGAGDHLLAHLPPKSALVRDARALASLSDEAFGAVYNDVIPADYAAVIGHLLPDRPEAHGAMVDLLVKTDPATRGQAESIVRQGLAAGMHKAEQVDLFGEREVMQSLMLERAKVLERGLSQLRKSKLLFRTAAKEADRLEAVGSKIAKSASEKEALANAQALELVSRLAFTHGPIADALNEASRKLAAGAKLADVADEFARSVKGTDLGALAREAANDDANRLLADGAGRGGDAAETIEAVREEQPSLTDLEHATERFSDPDGAATKQQAESRLHDLKASIAADEALQLERNSGFAVGLHAILDGGEAGQIGRYHWRRLHDPNPPAGDYIEVTIDGEPGTLGDDVSHLLTKGLELVSSGKVDPALAGELAPLLEKIKPLARRERIKAATHLLEDVKAGEFRAVEPFPDEPGYHRFRYVAKDGKAVGGNYVAEGNTIEGFNIGDVNNPVELGQSELRVMFEQLHAAHPEVKYVQAYRKSGARTKAGAGEQEIWLELTDKGVKFHREDPRPVAAAVHKPAPANQYPEIDAAAAAANPEAEARRLAVELTRRKMINNTGMGHGYKWSDQGLDIVTATGARPPKGSVTVELSDAPGRPVYAFKEAEIRKDAEAADKSALDLGEKVDPAIADRQRQEVALKAGSPLQGLADQKGEIGLGLFDHHDQLAIELHDEARAVLEELDADDKAIKALKDCL